MHYVLIVMPYEPPRLTLWILPAVDSNYVNAVLSNLMRKREDTSGMVDPYLKVLYSGEEVNYQQQQKVLETAIFNTPRNPFFAWASSGVTLLIYICYPSY